MKLRKLEPESYLMVLPLVVTGPGNAGNDEISYIIGGAIAVFVLAYLVYSLLKPDKF
jgi:K+-transporting ATPase KdpF subunit